MLTVLARAGATVGNVEVVRKAADLVRNPGSRLELDTLMVGAVAKSGNPKAALETAEKTLNLASQAESFLYIAHAYFDSGDQDAGLQMLDLASQRANGVTDLYQRGSMFVQIALAQLGAGARSKAARSLAQVDKRTVTWPIRADLAVLQVKAGDVNAALETVRDSGTTQLPAGYQAIAKQQVQMGGAAEDLDWIEKLDSPTDRLSALIGAAQGTLNRASGNSDHN